MIKIKGTIDCIKGAANEVIFPSGARNAESEGNNHKNKPTNKAIMVIVDQVKALFSTLESFSILGKSFSSISTCELLFKRGSTILSVIYQPTKITIKVEVPVKNQLFKGFN